MRIEKLLNSFIFEFLSRLLRSSIGVAAHHGNPNPQDIQIRIGKSLQDSILHRPGALVDSLGSSGRKERNEAVKIGVPVECLNQWLEGVIQLDKH